MSEEGARGIEIEKEAEELFDEALCCVLLEGYLGPISTVRTSVASVES